MRRVTRASGTALRPSPRFLGASGAVPASAGPCGPGRGSEATAAAGRPTGAGAPTRRAAPSAATAAAPAAVEARPATLPGAAEGRGTPRRSPRRERQRTRATAGSIPAAFRAGHCTAQAVRPARPHPYRRTGVHADPAIAGAGARRASLPTATPGRGSRARDSSAGARRAAGALVTLPTATEQQLLRFPFLKQRLRYFN